MRVDGKAYYEQRIIKEMTTGKKLSGKLDVDHKNRRRDDNRPANLRKTTRSENLKNRRGWAKKKK